MKPAPLSLERIVTVLRDRGGVRIPVSSLKPLLNFLPPALGLSVRRIIRFISEWRLVCFALHCPFSDEDTGTIRRLEFDENRYANCSIGGNHPETNRRDRK